jgi:hypothetical protein
VHSNTAKLLPSGIRALQSISCQLEEDDKDLLVALVNAVASEDIKYPIK